MKESSQTVWDGQDLEDNHRCLIITSSVWVLLRRGTLSLTPQSIHHENKHISLPSYDSLPFHIDHECMPSVFLSAVPRPSLSLAATTVLSHIQLLTLSAGSWMRRRQSDVILPTKQAELNDIYWRCFCAYHLGWQSRSPAGSWHHKVKDFQRDHDFCKRRRCWVFTPLCRRWLSFHLSVPFLWTPYLKNNLR